ncbi:glycosyltransferase family 2 protein [Aeromonas veronii]|nr:glycosyltransferase family 2 protein [Aeromonas veronii]
MSAAFVRFSIIIPVYNRDEPLQRALDSLSRQTCGNFEVIIIDDGSTPEFGERIQALVTTLADSRFSVICYQPNRNGAYARNRGIEVARGEYLCFLDSDDEWLPEKLERIDQILAIEPHWQVIHHPYQNVVRGERSTPFPTVARRADESVAEYSFCTNRIGGIQSSCLIVKRELAQRVRFNDKLRGHQDWDFALRLGAETDRFLFIDQVLTLRHVADAASGMVSRSLDYPYSLAFLHDYKGYFSSQAQAGYAAHVLLPKKINTSDRLWNRYEMLAVLYYPRQVASWLYQLGVLHGRCLRLLINCKRHNWSRIGLIGFNDYTTFFMNNYARWMKNILLIDRNKSGALVYQRQIVSIVNISQEQWKNIDCVATMTDLHHQSMCKEVRHYNPDIPITNF